MAAGAVVAALAWAGCGGSGGPMSTPVASYDVAALTAERTEKDQAFRAPGGPIPEESLREFPGLAYFPPNPALAFAAILEPFERQESARLMTTTGSVRMMTRVGLFTFAVDSTLCSLTVFRSESGEGHLFLPFKDASNLSETYEVGRYLDLVELPPGQPYILDFNRSYNPYCAYNPDYSCPIVPAENVLPVAIPAGEKRPSWLKHSQ